MSSSIEMVEWVYDELRRQVRRAEQSISNLALHTERAEVAGALQRVLFADLPYAASGAAAGDVYFVTNGLKAGETAGLGTGIPAYYNAADDTWRRFSDDVAVSS